MLFEWEQKKREAYLAELRAANRGVTKLAPEKHDALEYLCAARHNLHVGSDKFFLSDNPEHKQYEVLIGPNGTGEINQALTLAGLPKIEFDKEIFEVPLDKDFQKADYPDDFSYEIAVAEAKDHSHDLAEGINLAIEKYLERIDMEYGTHYKPTGKRRYHIERAVDKVEEKYYARLDVMMGGLNESMAMARLFGDEKDLEKILKQVERIAGRAKYHGYQQTANTARSLFHNLDIRPADTGKGYEVLTPDQGFVKLAGYPYLPAFTSGMEINIRALTDTYKYEKAQKQEIERQKQTAPHKDHGKSHYIKHDTGLDR